MFCTIKSVNISYTLDFTNELPLTIDGEKVLIWLGNGTNVERDIAHICFETCREIRILTKAVYERINKKV